MKTDEARKILNVSKEDANDEEVAEYIKTAALLKDIFFDMLKSGKYSKND